MAENAEIETLSTEQHEFLADVCRFRHELHCNQSALFFAEWTDHREYWERIAILAEMATTLFPKKAFPSIDQEDVPSDFDFNESYMWKDSEWWIADEDSLWWDEDDEEFFDEDERRDELREAAENYLLETAGKYNRDVESFLKEIDNEHGTNYCPTGATRIY